jgi:2-polyprenyl-6-methoxyphenol hydroxylase-like FAD-dependent oxidoreductase
MRTLQTEADLLIAGAGPSGLALAAELAAARDNFAPEFILTQLGKPADRMLAQHGLTAHGRRNQSACWPSHLLRHPRTKME